MTGLRRLPGLFLEATTLSIGRSLFSRDVLIELTTAGILTRDPVSGCL
jgi:hypothetical protein